MSALMCPHPDATQKWFELRREIAVRWCSACGALNRDGATWEQPKPPPGSGRGSGRKEAMIARLKEQWRNLGLFRGSKYDRLRDRVFTGHVSIGPVTIYGANAMHYAVNVRTDSGWICARPTTGGGHWRWYLYVSPNATPASAWWGIGPGYREDGGRYVDPQQDPRTPHAKPSKGSEPGGEGT